MLLPNYKKAVIPDDKLSGYCLNPYHSSGKHKAIVFKSVLGFEQKDADQLKGIILDSLATNECVEQSPKVYGRRFVVDFNYLNARIRTSWIIDTGKEFPRLTSCYILK